MDASAAAPLFCWTLPQPSYQANDIMAAMNTLYLGWQHMAQKEWHLQQQEHALLTMKQEIASIAFRLEFGQPTEADNAPAGAASPASPHPPSSNQEEQPPETANEDDGYVTICQRAKPPSFTNSPPPAPSPPANRSAFLRAAALLGETQGEEEGEEQGPCGEDDHDDLLPPTGGQAVTAKKMKKEQISPITEEEEERLLAEAVQLARREAEHSPPSTTKQKEQLHADLHSVPPLKKGFEGREEQLKGLEEHHRETAITGAKHDDASVPEYAIASVSPPPAGRGRARAPKTDVEELERLKSASQEEQLAHLRRILTE